MYHMSMEGDRTTGVHACVGTVEGVPRSVEMKMLSECPTGCMQSCEPVDQNRRRGKGVYSAWNTLICTVHTINGNHKRNK